MSVQLAAWLVDLLPANVLSNLFNRVFISGRRKGSGLETFDEDAAFLYSSAPFSTATNFEENRLWGFLRPLPGLLLWTSIIACFVLPAFAPWLVALVTLACMAQNILTMLFSLGYTIRGFRRMEHAMMHPVRVPSLPPRVVAGVVAALTGGAGASSAPQSLASGEVTLSSGGAQLVSDSPSANGGDGGSENMPVGKGVDSARDEGNGAAASSARSGGGGDSALVKVRGGAQEGAIDLTAAAALHPAHVLHLIAICRCTEPIEVLEDVLEHLAQHSNRRSYIVLLCLEAKDPDATAVGGALAAQFSGVFHNVMFAVHPSGIEGEVPGKSANVNWGVRAAHVALEAELGPRAADRIVVTVADCDAKASEHYFNELSVRFAASVREKRETFWAPPSLFDEESALVAAAAAAGAASSPGGEEGGGGAGVGSGSIGSTLSRNSEASRSILEALVGRSCCRVVQAFVGSIIPSPVRIADCMWSIFVLQNLSSVNWVRLPCSTYSVGLRLIASLGYWDTGVESVPEDYHTALKVFWGTAGRARCEPIYHPVLYQHLACVGWWQTMQERFQQGVRHMWGATDLAYILWLALRVPTVPYLSQLRIIATVTDVHVSSCACGFIATFAMPILSLMRPSYFSTPLGSTLLVTHEISILVLFAITAVTGSVYEWYAPTMVLACKRAALEGSAAGAANGCSAGSGLSSDALSIDVAPASALSSSYSSVAEPLPTGSLEVRDRSFRGMLSSCTRSAAFVHSLRLVAWLWTPLCAIVFLLGPASIAQTRLIFSNRMRKAHVSPKVAPTPSSTPRATPSLSAEGSAGGAHQPLSGGGHSSSSLMALGVQSGCLAAPMLAGGRAPPPVSPAAAPSTPPVKLQLPPAAFGRRA